MGSCMTIAEARAREDKLLAELKSVDERKAELDAQCLKLSDEGRRISAELAGLAVYEVADRLGKAFLGRWVRWENPEDGTHSYVRFNDVYVSDASGEPVATASVDSVRFVVSESETTVSTRRGVTVTFKSMPSDGSMCVAENFATLYDAAVGMLRSVVHGKEDR